ncbi:hypothetical protein [Methanofollis sp.]|uniref:hypothetical protein n=1 Tax=Methanofollis sp. TaxID=2052835 RepID=UPI00345A261C
MQDEVLKRSVLRSIEVIGEATKNLPPASGRRSRGSGGRATGVIHGGRRADQMCRPHRE